MKWHKRGTTFATGVFAFCLFAGQMPALACSPTPPRIDERVIIVIGRALILTEEKKGEQFSDAFEHRGTAEVFPLSTLQNELALDPPFRFEFSYVSYEGCIWGVAPDGESVSKLYLRVSQEKPYRIQLIAVRAADDKPLSNQQ